METIYVCSKCGANSHSDNQFELRDEGWLIGSHKAGRGQMVIRCPRHDTRYARSLIVTDRNIPAIH